MVLLSLKYLKIYYWFRHETLLNHLENLHTSNMPCAIQEGVFAAQK